MTATEQPTRAVWTGGGERKPLDDYDPALVAKLPERKVCVDCGRDKARADFHQEIHRKPDGTAWLALRARCRDCANTRRKSRSTTPATTRKETPQEETTMAQFGSSGENRQGNKSVLGFHLDPQYQRRLAGWGRALKTVGVHDEYQFLAAADTDLRAVEGIGDEALRTIRRAIKQSDEKLLAGVFLFADERAAVATPYWGALRDTAVIAEPAPAVAAEPDVEDEGLGDEDLEDEAVVALDWTGTWTGRVAPEEPVPESESESVTIPGPARLTVTVPLARDELSDEDVVAAARLLIEADDRIPVLRAELNEVCARAEAARHRLNDAIDERARAVGVIRTGRRP